jgi:hypothetical protein
MRHDENRTSAHTDLLQFTTSQCTFHDRKGHVMKNISMGVMAGAGPSLNVTGGTVNAYLPQE